MTQPTAMEIFNMLIEQFQRHNFSDIETFTLPHIEKQFEYDDYELNYPYLDSALAFRELEIQAQNPELTHISLSRLLDAAREYFSLAQSIPHRFKEELSRLTTEAAPEIMMQTIDDKQINLSESLNAEKIDEMLRLIGFLQQNLSEDNDDEFLNQLKF